jgi:hypothetical protein
LVLTQSSVSGASSASGGGVLDHLVGGAGGVRDGVDVAVLLDGEALDRLAGRGDALDDLPVQPGLDADDDDAGDVRVGAGADQRAEMQVEVGAELQPP